MVRIAPPPPSKPPEPIFKTLSAGSHLIRIFNTRHETQALTFRHYGPLNRFDHQRASATGKLQADAERGIYYAGFTLSCCVVEVFGDRGTIEIEDDEWVARVTLQRDLRLLDLSQNGAMRAGSVAALAKVADRALSQEWSRYFYEQTSRYGEIDGIHYLNAHNDEPAVALYERAQLALTCHPGHVMRMDSPSLRAAIQETAIANLLDFVP